MSEAITTVEPGLTFNYGVADANALWEVLNFVSYGHLPDGSHDPIWQCGCIEVGYEGHDVFRESKIISLANAKKALKEMILSNTVYYKSLRVGDILHYHNGFGQFVRCEVVDEEGSHVLKRNGLVGSWRNHDLPSRTRTGDIQTPHCSRIGTTFKPNYSTIYESPKYAGDKDVNPQELELIDLSVPEMTDAAKAIAESWVAVESVRKLLSISNHNPILILKSAKTLIDNALKDYNSQVRTIKDFNNKYGHTWLLGRF
jgi:hypothetical protein